MYTMGTQPKFGQYFADTRVRPLLSFDQEQALYASDSQYLSEFEEDVPMVLYLKLLENGHGLYFTRKGRYAKSQRKR